MNTQQGNFQRITHERLPLLRTILNFFIAYNIVSTLAGTIWVIFFTHNLLLIIATLVNISIVATLIWAKAALGTPAIKVRLQVFFGLAILIGVLGSFITSLLFYMIPILMLVSMMLFSIMGYFTSGKWFGYAGAAVFLAVGLFHVFVPLEIIHIPPDFASSLTTVVITYLLCGTIVMISISNDILIRAVSMATQRQQEAETVKEEINSSLTQVKAQAAEQERLLALIQDLETPAIPVLPGVLVLPIVGHLDSHRIIRLNDSLLERVSVERASTVLLDLTGVGIIDTATANHLIQMVRSVRLLGARCILTGVRSEVAQTMVTLGIDWGNIPTSASLQNAIQAILEERMQRV